jgi:hypothetical protein
MRSRAAGASERCRYTGLELSADCTFLQARLQPHAAKRPTMTVRLVLAFLVALLHFVVANVCAVIATSSAPSPVASFAMIFYVGLSSPVLIYRAMRVEPLSIDLLSWRTETPVNSLIFGVLVANVWLPLSKRGVRRPVIYAALAITFLLSAIIGWFLNRDVL